MAKPLISGKTKTEIYRYFKRNGGSYNELRVCFQNCGIENDPSVESASTTNKDKFLDSYVVPLDLSQLRDANKLAEFIAQTVQFFSPDGQLLPEAKSLHDSLARDGWESRGNELVRSAEASTSELTKGVPMSANVLGLVRRRDELVAINARKSNWPKITEWYARTRPLVAQYFQNQLGPFDELIKPPIWHIYDGEKSNDQANLEAADDRVAANAKSRLIAHLDAIIELKELQEDPTPNHSQVDKRRSVVAKTNKIFVVHGHDDEMKQNVARTLEKLGLIAVILHEQPNAGKTIIEKFEHNADVGFAVVLLSPDDTAYANGGDVKHAKPRARQNVVLELGYFVGKLGRDRVFTLKRGENLEVPSDFSGVVYTSYDPAGSWRFELVRELQTAGYTVDANKLTKQA